MKPALLFICSVLLASCGQFFALPENPGYHEAKYREEVTAGQDWQEKNIPDIVVLPHHGITGKNIDAFYQELADNHQKYDRIVVVSPDHFSKLSHPVESHPRHLHAACFSGSCVPLKSMHAYHYEHSNIFRPNGDVFEHGLWEHFIRIHRFFPDTPVTPIVIRRMERVGMADRRLIENLREMMQHERVLVILSVDFSHHVREDIARFHDAFSVHVLRAGTKSDFALLEVDCRNCLYIGQALARQYGKKTFDLWMRTSVDTLMGIFSDVNNTSHIFGTFTFWEESGDERQFVLFLNGRHFAHTDFVKHFYQEKDMKKPPTRALHHVGTGWSRVLVADMDGADISHIFVKWNVSALTEERILDWKLRFDAPSETLQVAWWDAGQEERGFDLATHMLACEVTREDFRCEAITW